MKFNIVKFSNLLLSVIALSIFAITDSSAQKVSVEGYTYQSGNRGYLGQVKLEIFDLNTDELLAETHTDNDGYFSLKFDKGNYKLLFSREAFYPIERNIYVNSTEKQFLKIEMQHKPGYLFEVTLAEKKEFPEQVVDAISGALIEVYNNTTGNLILELKDYQAPEFKVNLEKGNHYTILVRKEGFLAKRMEAYVDVEGCIVCIDGVGKVTPGVSDNLTDGGEYGVLLANVEMDRLFEGKKLVINNLYYDVGKYNLRPEAKIELDKVVRLLKYNPNMSVELSSHTDSRGDDTYNQKLSEERAKAAVNYIIYNGGIERRRIQAKGYGETQLLNRCSNGVQCTEEEHQMNRRTEIKIIGIEVLTEFKPLVEMKREEQMELLLKEIENQGQIKLKEGETIEDYVKNSTAKDRPENNEKEYNQELNDTQKQIMTTEIYTKPSTDIVPENMEVVTDQIPSENEDIMANSVVVENNDGIKYHVALHRSIDVLSADHQIYKDYNDVKEIRRKDGIFVIYIGDFDDAVSAINLLEAVQSKYPNASIIKTKSGKLIE